MSIDFTYFSKRQSLIGFQEDLRTQTVGTLRILKTHIVDERQKYPATSLEHKIGYSLLKAVDDELQQRERAK